MLIALIAFVVSTAAGSNDNCDVGILDQNYNTLVSAGSTAGKLNALGVQTVAITPTSLAAGNTYYAAFAAGPIGTTAAALHMTNASSTSVGDIFGTAAGIRMTGAQATFPIPTPGPVVIGAGISSTPYLAMRES